MADKENHELTFSVECIGCESSCEVTVRFQNGEIAEICGNNCPTGEAYARSIGKRKFEQERKNA